MEYNSIISRYKRIISIGGSKDRYVVDFKDFHDTVPEPPTASYTNDAERGTFCDMRFETLAEQDEDESDEVFESPKSHRHQHCNHKSPPLSHPSLPMEKL